MKTLNIIALVLVILIVLFLLINILLKFFKERIDNLYKMLNNAENDLLEKMKNKKELLIKMINYVTKKLKIESNTFDEVKNIEVNDLVNFKDESVFDKCYSEILEIREDNKKARETKDIKEFNQNIDEYEDNELHIISLRTFYNKYTLEYNNLIKKIPFNLVAKLKGYKIKALLEGREIDDSFNNDLEV